MPRYRRFRLSFRRRTQTILAHKSKRPLLMWFKLALSASVPLTIAIFTIVSYVQQMQINDNNREKDELLANATREKDLSIANLTRIQDQMIANITRYHDLEIANLTQIKDWEIAMANLNIANETKIQDRQIAEENRKEDRAQQQDLHYETVYSKYIEDISTILYKQPYNQTTFTSEEKKMLYIRRKTLITLRTIDSERRSLLFLFLYENNLLPDQSSPNTTISLMGANLRDITIRSPLTGSYEFNSLSLQSLNLINAVFIDCRFRGETNFSGSIMANVRFIGAVFDDHFAAYKAKLVNASFTDCTFKEIALEESNLSSTQFIRSRFDQLSAVSTDLTNGSFHHCQFTGTVDFSRSTMNGIIFSHSEFESDTEHQFDQVSLVDAHFHNTSLANIRFQYSNLSHADFSGTSLRNVQFTSKTLLINASLHLANVTQVNFTHVNLSGLKIDPKQWRDLVIYNAILPDGSWSINSDNLLKNGNAEHSCWRSSGEGVLWPWEEEVGPPVLYHHNTTDANVTNSLLGNCSFACTDNSPCSMAQPIDLKQFMLFIGNNELQYTVSAYFGSHSKCAQGMVDVWIVANQGNFKRQLSNPYIKSSSNSVRWQRRDDSYKLPKNIGDLFYIRVTFDAYSNSCYIDNIEFRLTRSSNVTRRIN